jgi:hypothetical protein
MNQRVFLLSDIATVLTGRNLCVDGLSGVYNLYGFLLGQNPYSHQIESARDLARKGIFEQYPVLEDFLKEITPRLIELDEVNASETAYDDLIESYIPKYGTHYLLTTLTAKLRDPRDELLDYAAPKNVVVVLPPNS